MQAKLHAFLTSALDGREWSTFLPWPLCPWIPMDGRLNQPQRLSVRCDQKYSAPAGNRILLVQDVTSHFTEIPAF